MSPDATKPLSIPPEAIKPVDAARNELAALREKAGRLSAKIAKIGRQAKTADRESADARDAIQADYVAALLEDRAPPPPDPNLVAKLKQGEMTVGASGAARRNIESEKAVVDAEVIAAAAAFSGNVFSLVMDQQASTQNELVAKLPELVPLLAQLAALDHVRERFCSGAMKLTAAANLRPWSGAAAVSKFLAAIPAQLSSPAIGPDTLRDLALSIADTLTKRIEEGNADHG